MNYFWNDYDELGRKETNLSWENKVVTNNASRDLKRILVYIHLRLYCIQLALVGDIRLYGGLIYAYMKFITRGV